MPYANPARHGPNQICTSGPVPARMEASGEQGGQTPHDVFLCTAKECQRGHLRYNGSDSTSLPSLWVETRIKIANTQTWSLHAPWTRKLREPSPSHTWLWDAQACSLAFCKAKKSAKLLCGLRLSPGWVSPVAVCIDRLTSMPESEQLQPSSFRIWHESLWILEPFGPVKAFLFASLCT